MIVCFNNEMKTAARFSSNRIERPGPKSAGDSLMGGRTNSKTVHQLFHDIDNKLNAVSLTLQLEQLNTGDKKVCRELTDAISLLQALKKQVYRRLDDQVGIAQRE
jgi:hypothetical protein